MISYVFNFIREDISSAYRRFRREWIDYWNDLPKSYQYRILLASSFVGFLWLLFTAILIYYLFSFIPFGSVVSFFGTLHTFLLSEDGFVFLSGLAGICVCISFALSAVARSTRL